MTGISFGIFRRFSALSSSISLAIHKVFLREIDLDRPKNHPKAALAAPAIVYARRRACEYSP